MDRLEAFNSMAIHPMLGRQFTKLEAEELKFCKIFITDNKFSSDNEYATKALRLFLGVTPKPKNWQSMEELLMAAMTKAKINN